jgi:hypothetical protein
LLERERCMPIYLEVLVVGIAITGAAYLLSRDPTFRTLLRRVRLSQQFKTADLAKVDAPEEPFPTVELPPAMLPKERRKKRSRRAGKGWRTRQDSNL